MLCEVRRLCVSTNPAVVLVGEKSADGLLYHNDNDDDDDDAAIWAFLDVFFRVSAQIH